MGEVRIKWTTFILDLNAVNVKLCVPSCIPLPCSFAFFYVLIEMVWLRVDPTVLAVSRVPP